MEKEKWGKKCITVKHVTINTNITQNNTEIMKMFVEGNNMTKFFEAYKIMKEIKNKEE